MDYHSIRIKVRPGQTDPYEWYYHHDGELFDIVSNPDDSMYHWVIIDHDDPKRSERKRVLKKDAILFTYMGFYDGGKKEGQ